ncbi:hypothetical protein HA466_0096790 [Hirschfeldia incana]|nr:hypothetical protein HA466_0096790 [Hirschfeldia incana]
MAKIMCIVTLLMIFLLISTAIPKGKAQCEGVPSRTTPPGICNLPFGEGACHNNCKTVERYDHGECDTAPEIAICLCYNC